MKKALLLTDCSKDSALSLGRWMASQPREPLDLTIVHAYTIESIPAYLLKAASYRMAKEEASRQLDGWLNFLSHPWPGKLQTETLLGDASLALTIHLLLRQYDYFLLDGSQEDMQSVFRACQNQIQTELHCLPPAENRIGLSNPVYIASYSALTAT